MDAQDIYLELILGIARYPKNRGRPASFDRHGDAANHSCGDKVGLFLSLEGDLIKEARFEGSGCAISMASASLLSSHLEGKSIVHAKALGKEEMLSLIRMDLSKNPTRMKCALIPLDALREALDAPASESDKIL